MHAGARPISVRETPGAIRYTVASLVVDHDHYREMLVSFRAAGFDAPDCEFIYLDNSAANGHSAYSGLNRLIGEARGDFVILCHQDVRVLPDRRADLDRRLAELERLDPAWALAGNAGGTAPGQLALRISDPHGRDRRVGTLPAAVASLDENFIVLRRAAILGFSHDLDGFHFYGADICLAADIMGYSAYVIDFHLEHLSQGNVSPAFHDCERRFRAKWARALRGRWLQTTCALVFVSGDRIANAVGGASQSMAARITKRLPRARGFTPASGRQP